MYNIFFIGLTNETVEILHKGHFLNIIGINYYDYFDSKTLNPIDSIFRIIYNLHYKKKSKFIKFCLLEVYNFTYFLSSRLYRKNKNYLNIIIKNNIEIVNTDNISLFESYLQNGSIDLIIINSWSLIPNKILSLPKFGTVNIHPSLLPQYKGALPTLWSLKNRDKSSAVSLVVIKDLIDNGIIVKQHHFEIEKNDDWLSVEKKISEILRNKLNQDVLDYLENNFTIVNSNIAESYTGRYEKYRQIKYIEENTTDIFNKVGLYPFLEPYIYCYIVFLERQIFIKKIHKILKLENEKVKKHILLKLPKLFIPGQDGLLYSYLFKDIGFYDSIYLINKMIIRKFTVSIR